MGTINAGSNITTYDLNYTGAQVDEALDTILNTDFDDIVDRAEAGATAAANSATAAGNSATAASGSADDAEGSADDAEAWAVGEIDGVAVDATDARYHNNSKYYAEQAAAAVTGVSSFNGRTGAVAPASGDYTPEQVGIPTQTGQSGKFLTTDGTDLSWATGGSGTLIVTATASGTSSFTTDYTIAEIVAALDAGQTVIMKYAGFYFPLQYRSGSNVVAFGQIVYSDSNDVLVKGRTLFMTPSSNYIIEQKPVLVVKEQTASYTLNEEDDNYCYRVTATSAITLTSGAANANDELEIVRMSTGAVTFTADSTAGMTLNGVTGGSITLSTQYDSIRLKAITATDWVVVEDNRAGNDKIFWATYGTTTSSEVYAAVTAGKECLMLRSGLVYRLAIGSSSSSVTFIYQDSTSVKVALCLNSSWSLATKTVVFSDDLADVTVYSDTITTTTTWTGSGPYTQTVTLANYSATSNTKVDIQPTAAQLAQLISDGVTALLVSNSSGTLTMYAVGAAPTTAMTLQVTITEVTAA